MSHTHTHTHTNDLSHCGLTCLRVRRAWRRSLLEVEPFASPHESPLKACETHTWHANSISFSHKLNTHTDTHTRTHTHTHTRMHTHTHAHTHTHTHTHAHTHTRTHTHLLTLRVTSHKCFKIYIFFYQFVKTSQICTVLKLYIKDFQTGPF